MTTYTTPDNIPLTDTTDLIADAVTNLRTRVNGVANATQQGLNAARAEATNGDSTTATNAAADATAKANQAKTDAITDATTKYGGLPQRMTDVEAKNTAQDATLAEYAGKLASTTVDLVVNGSFRDGFTGWTNTTGWVTENNGVTAWARAATGSAGLLNQSIVIPEWLRGKTLRLKVLVDTTSTGTYRSLVTTATGTVDVSYPLTTGPWSEKTSDIPIPASQGATPITVQVGRSTGNLYMTGIRLESV